ncbi:MAG: helicase C-terminal domain-containing protein [Chloroflexota bacterium]|nr:helicase C-terminal domain-containing protein [Chloroflexota bacterium]
MPKTYISLDLETTGLDSSRDAIIEVGALRFSGSQEIESFETFVNPGRHIPHFITELTGIADKDVAGAPSARQVMREVQDFVGQDPVVGHNVAFDLAFLRQHNTLVGNVGIDTFELASILVPHAGRYSLENLVREVGISWPPQQHRALDDARMAHLLYVELQERALRLPQKILQELCSLGSGLRWPPQLFFQEALRQRARAGFQGGIGTQLAGRRGGDVTGPLFLPEIEFDPLEARPEPIPLDVAELPQLLAEDGPLAQVFAAYEARPQQLEMAQAVTQAFNEGQHLLVEAGTGTGKSLAYLIPAVQWADQNDARVVISTNTINLQEQLARNDIPLLAQVFPTGFRAMVLKGRSHYLCRRQFQSLRRRGPSDHDEMLVLAKILIWLPNTLDGDGDTLFLPTPAQRKIWSRLSSVPENCDPHNCRYFGGEGCFFYQARTRAETVHLLVVNHALLLADIAAQNRVLPDYNYLIVDEAHHLERATTEALHFSINWYELRSMLDDLLRGRGNFPGLLGNLQGVVRAKSRDAHRRLVVEAARLTEVGERVTQRLSEFFDVLTLFLAENETRNSNYATRLRIISSLRTLPSWDAVEITWGSVAPSFATLAEGLGRLCAALEDLDGGDDGLEVTRSQLIAISRRLVETYTQLNSLVAEPSDNAVYWLEESRKNRVLSCHVAPLRIGPLVREQLFEKKKAVILTSATLQVGGSFDYLRERLSAGDAEELAVGSPFDYASAALLYIANDVPVPGRPGHQKAVSAALTDLFRATEGRGMALFTSYSQLRATAKSLTGPLAAADINVYAQGGGSSRAGLLANFRKDKRAVLLGTRSFWEGVDIPGDALSCLAIVKLPFDVPSDPLVAARGEACDDAFNDYMVPEAILRFLQGFGRLIRTRTDRGVVALLDGRLLTKRYGSRFIASLPDPTVRKGSVRQMPELAALWLAGEPLPSEAERSPDEPWLIPPPEEPPWWD